LTIRTSTRLWRALPMHSWSIPTRTWTPTWTS
jgi:hypothetical protein